MQAGGRRGHGPSMAGKDGLVIVIVGRICRALGRDIGRQRHLPGCGQGHIKVIARQIEPQFQIGFRLGQHTGRKLIGKHDLFTCQHLAQGLGKGAPALWRGLQQRDLDLRHGLAPAPRAAEARGNDLGVVQHQNIARLKNLDQIAHMMVADLVPLGQQKPGRTARACGAGRNQRLGQLKVKIRKFHGQSLPCCGLGRGLCPGALSGAGVVSGAAERPPRNSPRSMPGVRIERGFTPTSNASAVPCSV